MEGQRDLHATIDTHYIPYPPTIYTTLAGYGIAERDGERCESGRRVCLRIGTACDTVRSGTCMWCCAERDCVRYGVDRDGVRAYGSGRRAIRCGSGRCVCERLRIDDLRAEREVVRYELTTTYERDALRAGRRTN